MNHRPPHRRGRPATALGAFSAALLALLALAALVALVASAPVAVRAEAPSVTYSRDIAPLLQARCVECHREGTGAPFVLTDYDSAKRRARTIVRVLETGFMPPWHAVGGDVPLVGDRRLDSEEIALFRDWLSAGVPEGDPSDLPPPRHFPDGWRLGEPDLVVSMDEAYPVPAEGPDIYRHFVIPTGLEKEVYVKAVEFRPSSPSAVHHSLIYYDSEGRARTADAEDPEPGFTEMPLGEGTGRQIGGWVPGSMPHALPEGLAHRLAPGGDIVLQTHFHPSGREELERSTVALYFSDEPPQRPFTSLQIPPLFGAFAGIDLPPGAEHAEIRDSFFLPVPVRAFGAHAHAHYRGKSLRMEAILPDGSELVLLNIPEWDMNWQEEYRFAEEVPLPAGTRIDVEVAWDNSALHHANPVVPPVRVRWGLESLDEMGSIDLFVISKGEDLKAAEAAMRTLRSAYRDHLVWSAGSHLLTPEKLASFASMRERAIRRFDRDGDGVLNPEEREAARELLKRDPLP